MAAGHIVGLPRCVRLALGQSASALTSLSGHWIDCVHGRRLLRSIVLDMDSSVSPTYGDQEGTAYNGHFACTCYHPAVRVQSVRRPRTVCAGPGNVHSADDWKNVLSRSWPVTGSATFAATSAPMPPFGAQSALQKLENGQRPIDQGAQGRDRGAGSGAAGTEPPPGA